MKELIFWINIVKVVDWYSASVLSAPVYRTENFNTCFCLFRNCEIHGPMNRGSCVGGKIFCYALNMQIFFENIVYIYWSPNRQTQWMVRKRGKSFIRIVWDHSQNIQIQDRFHKIYSKCASTLFTTGQIAVNWSACIKDHGNLYQKKNFMGPRPNALVLE